MDPENYQMTTVRLCKQCGAPHERRSPWCQTCVDAINAAAEARSRADHVAMMRYVDPSRTVAPPPPLGQPTGPCPRCQTGHYVDRGNGVFSCAACHFTPGDPGVTPL